MIHADRLTGRAHLLIGDIFLAVDDIFTVCSLKQPCILQNHAEQGVHIAALHFRYRHAVYAYLAAPQLVKTHEQVHHRGFACTRVADYCNLLSGQHLGREVVYDGLILVITESYMVEGDLARDLFGISSARAVIGKLLFLEEAKHTLTGGTGGHELGGCLRYLRKRICKQAHICDKGHYNAKRDSPAHGEGSSHDAHGDIAEVADKAHERHH